MHSSAYPSAFALALALALSIPVATALDSGWFLAGSGQSCDDACSASLGRNPCHLRSLQAIDEAYFLERVKLGLGISAFACPWNRTQVASKDGPSMDASSAQCFLAPPSASCSVRPTSASVSRLCCCSLTTCSTSMEPVLSEWRKFVPNIQMPVLYLPLDGCDTLHEEPF
jgi:hypothetical protein